MTLAMTDDHLGPFICQWCFARCSKPYKHEVRGWCCPHCDRPVTAYRRLIGPVDASAALRVVQRSLKPRRYSRLSSQLRSIAERDHWICQLCGQPVDPRQRGVHRPSLDHIVRRCDGGTGLQTNLRLAHQSCNEAREGARVTPFAPLLEDVA